MKQLPLNIGVLHFIGIGGIGMSGIAEALHHLGYKIQGSDIAENANVQRLRALGMYISIGHDANNIKTPNGDFVSAVVRSSAVKEDNAEVIAAHENLIPVIRRAEMLAELMRFKWSIAVGGTHGKTTTTSMIGHILEQANLDPTIINGGIINHLGTNTRMGKGDWMVVEADESDGTFQQLPAIAGVITNIEAEHMDYYENFDALLDAFKRFVSNIPFYGFVAVCGDDPVIADLLPQLPRKTRTYGFADHHDLCANNLRPDIEGMYFDLHFGARLTKSETITIKDCFMPVFGKHNILNAMSALIIGQQIGIDIPEMVQSLAKFGGVKRRFTKTGTVNGAHIIDDYAHHPTEIRAVLSAAKDVIQSQGKGHIYAIMQPHRYTRLAEHFDDFAQCFSDADKIYITDVYAAGEMPIDHITQDTLVMAINKNGQQAQTIGNVTDLATDLAPHIQEGDIVICLGAGNITQWAYDLPQILSDMPALKTAS